jgi:hypothetical protein
MVNNLIGAFIAEELYWQMEVWAIIIYTSGPLLNQIFRF